LFDFTLPLIDAILKDQPDASAIPAMSTASAMSTPLAAFVTPEPPAADETQVTIPQAADETPGITQTQSADETTGRAASVTPAETQAAVETPGPAAAETPASMQTDDTTSAEAAAAMPPASEYCLRCSKDLHNLEGFKCTRPSAYVKCRECARKRKPCESVPAEFSGRFEEVHRLLRKSKLSDLPMAEYEKARASYKTDVESYLKKSGSPQKRPRAAPAPMQSDTNSLLQTLIDEVRGLRNDYRSKVCFPRFSVEALSRVRLTLMQNDMSPLPEEEKKFHGGAVEGPQ
jgi:hypothetical protein